MFNLEDFTKDFLEQIRSNPKLNQNSLKIELCKKYDLKNIPKDTQILSSVCSEDREELIKFLNIKPVREISGVTVVALFSKPHNCPHGKCVYCPGGLNSNYGDTPQSYTGEEPAAMRAKRNFYDPYLQIFNRLEHYVINGHFPDKIEAIIMGGTFSSLEKSYQDEFINYVYKAFNDFADLFFQSNNGSKKINYNKFLKFFEFPRELNNDEMISKIQKKILKLKDKNLIGFEREILRNEKAYVRCIGLTIETRPNCREKIIKEVNQMLEYGCTRFELGVQTLDDEILRRNNRGHSLRDTIDTIQIFKDMCFKINAHIMIGLLGSDFNKDVNLFRELFECEDFRPDMIKIYPCLLSRGTALYKEFESGNFKPLSTKEASKIIAQGYRFIPNYVRVMRVQRDIPTNLVEFGIKNSNLRQIVDEQVRRDKIVVNEIREREVGFRVKQGMELGDFKIKVNSYKASGGVEYFISVEDENLTLLGFVRFRVANEYGLREEIVNKTGLVRELHVYGNLIYVGEQMGENFQHKGWGKKLMSHAERIAQENGCSKMVVISGVGVREYYAKLGYKKQGPYMVKNF